MVSYLIFDMIHVYKYFHILCEIATEYQTTDLLRAFNIYLIILVTFELVCKRISFLDLFTLKWVDAILSVLILLFFKKSKFVRKASSFVYCILSDEANETYVRIVLI